jgi:8-oxo-dGTP diphosphatase
MKTTTLCFLMKGEEILLAMKKTGPRGFGVGKWNGVGGKVEAGESIEQGAIREAQEEIGVQIDARDLVPVGTLEFHYDGSPDWDQTMHIFIAERWTGEPTESGEMRPQWFSKKNVPFASMWADDPYWLPQMLAGKKVSGAFLFDATGKTIISHEINFGVSA